MDENGNNKNDEDHELWMSFTADIKAYKQDEDNVPKKRADTEKRKPVSGTAPAASWADLLPSQQSKDLSRTQDLHYGNNIQPSIESRGDKNLERKLRQGKLPVDVTLDLHGLTLGQAKAKLESVLQTAYSADKRCILVITGKGQRQDGAPIDPLAPKRGAIRQEFKHWLAQPSLSHIILQVAEAKQGAGGAYYVYLRRRK